jgi:adenylate cyclase class 2
LSSMQQVNIEIKARCSDHEKIRRILKNRNALYKGVDHQIDTYFKVRKGRLKLREGTIENDLIYYNRENKKGPKQSDVIYYTVEPGSTLKSVLLNSHDVLVVIDKKREIYFIDNIKFHIDIVEQLGTFLEIEAIGSDEYADTEVLLSQCKEYLTLFAVEESDLVLFMTIAKY